jgi:hypothetical protein
MNTKKQMVFPTGSNPEGKKSVHRASKMADDLKSQTSEALLTLNKFKEYFNGSFIGSGYLKG